MKKALKFAMLLISALILFSCSKEGSSASSGKGNSSKKKVKLAFVTNGASDFWLYSQAGLQKIAIGLNRNPERVYLCGV